MSAGMTRAEYLAVTGAFFERLMFTVKDLPTDRLTWPLDEHARSVNDLFAELTARAERVVRALEFLYHGGDPSEFLATARPTAVGTTRSMAHLKIAHTTVSAALERVPDSRLSNENGFPDWLVHEYMTPLEQAVPLIENWAKSLRERGQAGPTGLPVIQ